MRSLCMSIEELLLMHCLKLHYAHKRTHTHKQRFSLPVVSHSSGSSRPIKQTYYQHTHIDTHTHGHTSHSHSVRVGKKQSYAVLASPILMRRPKAGNTFYISEPTSSCVCECVRSCACACTF